MREALYGDLPATVRVALHGDLGRALAAAGAPVGQAAEHVLPAARPGDRDAVACSSAWPAKRLRTVHR